MCGGLWPPSSSTQTQKRTYRNSFLAPIDVAVADLVVGQRAYLGPQFAEHSNISKLLYEVPDEMDLRLGP